MKSSTALLPLYLIGLYDTITSKLFTTHLIVEDNEIFIEAIYNFHIKLKTCIFNHLNGFGSLFLYYQRLGKLMKGTESTITTETSHGQSKGD